MSERVKLWARFSRDVLKPIKSALKESLKQKKRDPFLCYVLLSCGELVPVTVQPDCAATESMISISCIKDSLPQKANDITYHDETILDTLGGTTQILGSVMLTMQGPILKGTRDILFHVYVNKGPSDFDILLGRDLCERLGIYRISANAGHLRRNAQGKPAPFPAKDMGHNKSQLTLRKAEKGQKTARDRQREQKKQDHQAEFDAYNASKQTQSPQPETRTDEAQASNNQPSQ